MIPSPTIKIDIDFALMGITNSYWDYVLYGGVDSASNCVGIRMSGQTQIEALYGRGGGPTTGFVLGERYRIHMENNLLVLDDTTTVSGTYRNFVGANYPIYVFGANSSGSFWRGTHTRIYKLKIYDGEDLIRDFVPCYNKTTAEYGLYDAANQEFYGNAAGTGSGKLLGSSFVEESESCKFLDYEQYFVDHDMKNNISNTTITGTGVADDPYIINSSEDFWWASKFQSWENKYVELGSNVVLNEEKFDQDGNATGGDGIVYLWKPQSKWGYLQGNEHVVSGYYIKPTGVGAYLVGTIVSVENCYFDNFYCYSPDNISVGLCSNVTTIKNVHTLGGFVERGGNFAAGFAHQVKSLAKDCSNNAMVKATGYIGGLFVDAVNNVIIENCVNYAKLEGDRTCVGGIIQSLDSTSTIRNCVNYGDIIVGMYHIGGVVCYARGSIINCVNYGKFNKSDGGIAALAADNLNIVSCKNFSSTSRAMIGSIQLTNKNKANIINIIDCYMECSQDARIICGCQSGVTPNNTIVNIKDYHCVISKNAVLSQNKRNLVLGDGSIPITLNMENIFIECYAEKLNLTICWAYDGTVTNVKNLYIKAYSKQVDMRRLIREMPNSKTHVQGIIVENNYEGEVVKDYYGTEFSDFNISWKTGAISLNAMSSQGGFAPRLTEENLIGMGYVKKVI